MTPDMVSELLRQLMKESMILAAPVLIAAALLAFVLSLVQTLTSLQEQSLTSSGTDFAGRDAVVPGQAGSVYAAVDLRFSPLSGLGRPE
jgi:hypothetical protein